MIKLVDETRVNKKGETVDNSLYLIGVDSNNLALARGDTPINYFGDLRTALTRSLNYAIKGSETELSLEMILSKIEELDNNITKVSEMINQNTKETE